MILKSHFKLKKLTAIGTWAAIWHVAIKVETRFPRRCLQTINEPWQDAFSQILNAPRSIVNVGIEPLNCETLKRVQPLFRCSRRHFSLGIGGEKKKRDGARIFKIT